MTDPLPENTEPANLKMLRRMVTALMAVMILGFILLIALFAVRLTTPSTPTLALPDQISLPDGAKAVSYSQGTRWYAVTTDTDLILIYDLNHQLIQQIEVNLP